MSSSQNPLHLSSCYCYGYRFWGALSLSRVLWKSAYSRSNMKPIYILNRLRNGSMIEELFWCFQVFGQHFMFLSYCIHLHASSFIFLSFAFIVLSICIHVPSFSFEYSFHVSFICINVLSFSFHFHFKVHSCPFIFFHLHACSVILHLCPFMYSLKLWTWLYGLARGPSATNGYR